MARITVYIPDDVYMQARTRYLTQSEAGTAAVNVSKMVTDALVAFHRPTPRAERSERGRVETLRASRAARAALADLEATLTQARPVKRRVRRL
jgi:hypothetical protein